MQIHGALVTILISLLFLSFSHAAGGDELGRKDFPDGFIFGTASSAYQYEGAAREGGKGLSVWDTYVHKHPEKIEDRSNGDVAIDSYHRYKEDVALMKDMGMDAYRFSISWPRILPSGSPSGGLNVEGIEYYNKLINELISNGIQPFVTLFHWDLPQALQDKYGGFLSQQIDFRAYAEICFQEFGDRVKHWITFNEPYTYSVGGYAMGFLAPGRCSPGDAANCLGGDSSEEPYIVSHNQILAHAEAVKLYRDKYQVYQNGKIGIALVSNWMIPYSESKPDSDAANRALDFMYGWFMDPLTTGDYPVSMKSLVGVRLPRFTMKQSMMVNGSWDFIGLNYYTARFAANIQAVSRGNLSYNTDSSTNLTVSRNGALIGPRAASTWLYVYPRGIRDILLYTKSRYSNPMIYIMENGVDEINNNSLSVGEALNDTARIDYYHQHLLYVQRAIRQGVNVKGYFAWSLLDNFEWMNGYTVRFGINFVDYENGLKRYPKSSSIWFRKFLKRQIKNIDGQNNFKKLLLMQNRSRC